nr:tail protein X [uncultured Dysosmobacter sp.]
MSRIYTTIQGDTWDSIAFKLFGSEKYMKDLIEANWPLLEVLVFSSGTEITVPDIPDEIDADLPFWRTEDADEEDEEIDDYVEDEEDVEDYELEEFEEEDDG